jgi:hypothetical protein
LSPLEKLARAICWAGFSAEGRAGRTEAAYWRGISEDARASYLAEASRMVWLHSQVPPSIIDQALAADKN